MYLLRVFKSKTKSVQPESFRSLLRRVIEVHVCNVTRVFGVQSGIASAVTLVYGHIQGASFISTSAAKLFRSFTVCLFYLQTPQPLSEFPNLEARRTRAKRIVDRPTVEFVTRPPPSPPGTTEHLNNSPLSTHSNAFKRYAVFSDIFYQKMSLRLLPKEKQCKGRRNNERPIYKTT